MESYSQRNVFSFSTVKAGLIEIVLNVKDLLVAMYVTSVNVLCGLVLILGN
jgi:energy-converting hydrogenase Eha subunit C